jgi:hypothetical protein
LVILALITVSFQGHRLASNDLLKEDRQTEIAIKSIGGKNEETFGFVTYVAHSNS